MAMAPCARAQVKPNIVWLVSEDHGPHMGCYGDTYATTPNVDRLASTSLRYRRCWSNAPVCAPARTTLILGLYATSSGGEHMRSMVPMPRGLQMYPQLLREAGYYCTNNAKEDYNVAKPGKVWDESSKNAHWKNRPEDKPFFAVFNSEKSHESRMRARPHKPIHDPARVRIPAYHPDTPEVRRDWAQYYDVVSAADADAGDRLQELAAAGLLEDTIVFYFADHGSGMPRNKRWPYNSGLHVPLVVHIPDRFRELRPDDYQPGGVSDRLVSFVDFAPTLLSLAGVKPPDWMQGHAFLGKFIAPPQPHLYGFRGRMDERYDLVRSVTDGRYVYVRQYMPRLIYGQHVEYMFQTPTTVVWKQLHDAGRLTAEQDHFWNRKPSEELYDLQSDPDEVHNLAYRQGYQEIRSRLRNAQLMHSVAICDLGFLTEGERFERAHGDSQYDFGHDASRYPIKKILNAAEQATMPEADDEYAIKSLITDSDSAVRYWCIQGIQLRGKEAAKIADRELRAALTDTSPYVRIAAAQTLLEQGDAATVKSAMMELVARADWSKNNVFVAIAALDVLDAQPDQAARFADQIRLLPVKGPAPDPRYSDYVPRLLEHLNAALK
jgi:uncharacterized sulfatase